MMYKLSIIVLLLASVDVELTTAACTTIQDFCNDPDCTPPPPFCVAILARGYPCPNCAPPS